ncbi:MAG: B12-binding domain-containing radical SAM protein [Bacillota bacterium]
MKILLTTLNAKFVHTSLALWYLYQFCRGQYPELAFREFNINQELSWICGEIYLEKADVAAFSCNIWNIDQILIICKRLKAISPSTIILLGGPEVSVNPEEVLRANPAVDFVIAGEGELTFKEWLGELGKTEPDWAMIKGLAFREGDGVTVNQPRPPIMDLGILPFPYPEDLVPFRQKLVYYETSRGCPYSCQYCLSANEHGVRFFPWERVEQDLLRFIKAGIGQVKLVDRSFNCNPAWAKKIWRLLIANPGKTNFHFEIVGDLLDDESREILAQAPAGLFQFEIGVQSTNRETLRLIQRRMDFPRLAKEVSQLVKSSRVFVHLDLIAGLPGEDYQSFAKSFNDSLLIKPNRLQLGFLKLLKGSGLRTKVPEYGYIFTDEPPYEVLSNRWISYQELLKLKTIEELLERYYNCGRFKLAFTYLIPHFSSPFALFESLAEWWKQSGYDQIAHKSKDLYSYLLRFYQTVEPESVIFKNILKYDLLSNERLVELPEWAGKKNPELHSQSYRFWQNPSHREQYIPGFAGLAIRDIQRRVIFEEFDCDPREAAAAPLKETPRKPLTFLFVYQDRETQIYPIERKELME